MSFAEKYLDGEKLFTVYWAEMGGSIQIGGAGSYGRLVKWCKANNVVHPATGKSPSVMGVWFASWSWALKNTEQAYKIVKDAYAIKGRILTEDKWKIELEDKKNTRERN